MEVQIIGMDDYADGVTNYVVQQLNTFEVSLDRVDRDILRSRIVDGVTSSG